MSAPVARGGRSAQATERVDEQAWRIAHPRSDLASAGRASLVAWQSIPPITSLVAVVIELDAILTEPLL
jgi:hypothetical protein